jgi:phospholipid/cholesterol/gamma-HCH transport system ATP-binding protein
VPDNLGMLFRKELVMFGPREVLLTSDEPVVEQFLNGRKRGPIGMSEEKDTATMAREEAEAAAGHSDGSPDEDIRGVVPQMQPSPGLPERAGARRRMDRVMRILHTLPPAAQEGIIESLSPEEQRHYNVHPSHGAPVPARHGLGDTQQIPRVTGPVPNQHHGELPADQVARIPGGWSGNPGNAGEAPRPGTGYPPRNGPGGA